MNYSVAGPADAEEIGWLLAGVFSASDPPAAAMGVTAVEMEQFLGLIMSRVIADGLTVIARSKENGKLAGALLADDFVSSPEVEPALISPKLLPIFAMLGALDEQFREGKSISRGRYLHLFMLGVDREFGGQGVAQGLVQACLENGRSKGYGTALTEATGRISQHIFRKNSFAERFRASYQDFVYRGQMVFGSIRGHEATILMERVLD